MNPIFIRAIAGAMATAVATLAAPANAGGHRHHHQHSPVVQQDAGGGGLNVAGIAGAARPGNSTRTADSEPVYRNPPYFPRPSPDRDYLPTPVHKVPHPAVPRSYEPWSAEWLRYCAGRYPSFDPQDGTFAGRDGVRRFCVTN